MGSPNAIAKEDTFATLACFEVGGAEFALDIEYVREIVRMTEISALPNAPELIEGVVDLRGGLIPVIDLARLLNRGRARSADLARIVVIEYGDLAVGLWVDAALNVFTLEASCLEPVPGLAMRAGYDAVSAMLRREGKPPIMILSLENLIESVYRAAESSATEGEVT